MRAPFPVRQVGKSYKVLGSNKCWLYLLYLCQMVVLPTFWITITFGMKHHLYSFSMIFVSLCIFARSINETLHSHQGGLTHFVFYYANKITATLVLKIVGLSGTILLVRSGSISHTILYT